MGLGRNAVFIAMSEIGQGSKPLKEILWPAIEALRFPSRVLVDSDAFGTLGWTLHVRSRGARIMRVVLGDLLLFFFLALFVTGILIAAASLLI